MDTKHNNAVYPDVPPEYNQTEAPPPAAQPAVFVQSAQPQANLLGSKPTIAICPSCGERRMTKIEYKASSKTHLIAVILGITTFCCCIPYCIDSCKNIEHLCGNCGAFLGTYNN